MSTMEKPKIEPNEICDKCTAKAVTVAVKGSQSLVFCQHHANQYAEALNVSGFDLHK